MLLHGFDKGTSCVKVSVVDATTQQTLASVNCPDTEREIIVQLSAACRCSTGSCFFSIS